MERRDYNPGGLTALYDTIGIAISETEKHKTNLKQRHRPDMILMVIITDGQENASREYSSLTIKSLIEKNEKRENWQFIYLGADLSNFVDADTLGIRNRASTGKSNLKEKFNVVSEHTILFRKANLEEDSDVLMCHFVDDLNEE